MIFWLFGIISCLSALAATFLSDIKLAALSLWFVGLAAGGLYLSLGAEFLAITQWIVSTLICGSLTFYSVMFGEYGRTDSRPLSRKMSSAVLPVLAGGAVAWAIWSTGTQLGSLQVVPAQASDLLSLGRKLADENFLALEILALTLFLVVVGAGVVVRPERRQQ